VASDTLNIFVSRLYTAIKFKEEVADGIPLLVVSVAHPLNKEGQGFLAWVKKNYPRYRIENENGKIVYEQRDAVAEYIAENVPQELNFSHEEIAEMLRQGKIRVAGRKG
jgi:hypothetical protein